VHKPIEMAAQMAKVAREAVATFRGDRGIFRTLSGEHEAVTELIEQCRATEPSGPGLEARRELFDRLRTELLAHDQSEARVLYSALEANDITREEARRCEREHEAIGEELAALSTLGVASPEWAERIDQLEHDLVGHVDEEEHALFPLAKRVLSHKRLHEIDHRFAAEKERALEELAKTLH
jgi:iron-sulfur cluster repair protein YtfE (RIC family)